MAKEILNDLVEITRDPSELEEDIVDLPVNQFVAEHGIDSPVGANSQKMLSRMSSSHRLAISHES